MITVHQGCSALKSVEKDNEREKVQSNERKSMGLGLTLVWNSVTGGHLCNGSVTNFYTSISAQDRAVCLFRKASNCFQ